MAQQSNSNIALCPECDGPVKLGGKMQIGQKLNCRRCGSTLVVASKKPLELVSASGGRAPAAVPTAPVKKEREAAASAPRQASDLNERSHMPASTQASWADCPECSASLPVHMPVKVHQLVVCPQCDETLEIISLDPIELSWANDDPWYYGQDDDLQRNTRSRR